MKVYLKRKRGSIDAKGVYDVGSRELTVLKGSRVATEVREFRGASKVVKLWSEYTKNGIVTKDVSFTSSSTAANFVTGVNTNGLLAWKTEDGLTLKESL